MSDCVMDASALLALALGEKGGDAVFRRGRGATISAVNHSECIAKVLERGVSPEALLAEIRALDLNVAAFDETQSVRAAQLRPLTRVLGLSFGDRACLALAQSLKLPVLTADRTWLKLKIGVKIEAIR